MKKTEKQWSEHIERKYLNGEYLIIKNRIEVNEANAIGKYIQSNKSLKSLAIHDDCNLGREEAIVLFNALELQPSIYFLNIVNKDIGADEATILSNALAPNTSITKLALHNCKFSQESAKLFFKFLQSNSSINSLTVAGSGISFH